MYDELIKRLRETPSIPVDAKLHNEAANAIEELQKQLQKSEVDNINLTGWLAEEHAKLDRAEIENIKLKEEFAKYRGKHRWIPVTERLPEKNQEVLIFLFGDDPYIAWHNGEYWITEDFRLDEPDDWQPTHWFPLPQPPEDGES